LLVSYNPAIELGTAAAVGAAAADGSVSHLSVKAGNFKIIIIILRGLS
jgi:hypothetical protein